MKARAYFPILLIAVFLISCNQSGQKAEPETIENLKTAIKGELIANAKYWEYADMAAHDSLFKISAMFRAAAVSEKDHADNQITLLLAHGQNLGKFTPEYDPYDLRKNLETAIEVEHFEATDQYPRFIAKSNEENMPDVAEAFNWALQAEIKHRDWFSLALNSLDDPSVELPVSYMVCPRCGNTQDAADYNSPCDICENDASRFVEVK